jgi:hypothetical protein
MNPNACKSLKILQVFTLREKKQKDESSNNTDCNNYFFGLL